jgi:hypothetical protein
MASIDVVSYNRQGKVYTGTNVSAKALTAVATAMTGLILYNPFGSGKKLVLVDAGFVTSVVGTGVGNLGIAIAPTVPLGPTSATSASCSAVLSAAGDTGSTSVAKLYDTATFATAPVMQRWIGGNIWVTGGAGDHPYQIMDRIDGSLILVPGAAAMLSIVTTVMTGMGHFTWAEVPV